MGFVSVSVHNNVLGSSWMHSHVIQSGLNRTSSRNFFPKSRKSRAHNLITLSSSDSETTTSSAPPKNFTPKLKSDDRYIAELFVACFGIFAISSALGIKPPLPLLAPPLLSAGTLIKKPAKSISELKSRGSMNSELITPENFAPQCSPPPSKVSPVYNVTVENLRDKFFETVKDNAQRTVISFADDETMTYGLIQRSLLLQFPDLITVQFIKIDENSSTLAIYSQSIYGAGDLGVNANRVENWLSLLKQKIDSTPKN